MMDYDEREVWRIAYKEAARSYFAGGWAKTENGETLGLTLEEIRNAIAWWAAAAVTDYRKANRK